MKTRNFNKRSVYNICVCALLICLISCDSDFISEVVSRETSILSVDESSQNTWQQQLQNIMQGEMSSFYEQQNLKLERYELMDDEIKNNPTIQSLVPYYNDSIDCNKFLLKTIGEVSKIDDSFCLDYYLNFKQALLKEYEDEELMMVRLYWEYNNFTFTTNCIVLKEKVVYDDILSNIHYISLKEESVEPTPKKIKRTKSATETKQISLHYKSTPLCMYDGAGNLMALAYYYYELIGHEDEHGKYIDSYEYRAPVSVKNSFYTAKGEIVLISSDTGVNGHFEYKYAVAVGTSAISITFMGVGFSISGAALQDSGGRRVLADELYDE